jgi:hypothetical protein
MEEQKNNNSNLSLSTDYTRVESKRKAIDHILYHTNSMTSLAQKIMGCSNAKDFMTLGRISWERYSNPIIAYHNFFNFFIEEMMDNHCWK